MMIKNDDKEQRNIKLAADHEVRQLLDMAMHNWKVAQSRMLQIVQEREKGIYDDNGVEVMAVYARMERVYACITDLLRHPQIEQTLTQGGSCQYFTTESEEKFKESAQIFLHETVNVHHIDLD